MVFDCESIGLHGQCFWVGYVVVDQDGRELESGEWACPPENAYGSEDNMEWVRHNVPNLLKPGEHGGSRPADIREPFWQRWLHWKAQGAMMAADVAWPVEARFLLDCVMGDFNGREWDGPYPLVDIASVRLAAGMDPLETLPRRHDELPVHNPVQDARQSARLLLEALSRLDRRHLAAA